MLGTNNTNVPVSGNNSRAILSVMCYNNGGSLYAAQTYIECVGSTNKTYIRVYDAPNWSSWKLVTTTSV